MLLIKIGLSVEITQWIMACLSSVKMVVLINGSPTKFFNSHRGLRQGCPLSPLMFLLVVECLSRLLKEAVTEGSFHGIKVASSISVTHLLFVDDVLILGCGDYQESLVFKSILTLFCTASGMEGNCHKLVFLAYNIDSNLKQILFTTYNIPIIDMEVGMKYLGFFLKPNGYIV
jgi:hypothetical protein